MIRLNPFGISFNIGFAGWYPSIMISRIQMATCKPQAVYEIDDGVNARHVISETSGFGFRFDILAGTLRAPMGPFWKLDYWKNRAKYNHWESGLHAFVYTIPLMIGFFCSMTVPTGGDRQSGFYFGLKNYRVDKTSNKGGWASPEEMGNFYMVLTSTARRDMIEEA